MEGSVLVDAALTEAHWVLAGSAIGFIAVLAAIVVLAQRKSVAAGLAVLGVGLVQISGVLAGVAGLANQDLYTGVMASGMIRVVTALAILPVGFTLAAGLAFVGARDAPRSWRAPALVGLFCAIVGVATVVEGVVASNPVFGVFRGLVVAAFGVLACVAVSSTGRDSAGADGALGGGLVFALVVAAMEAANAGMIAAFAVHSTVVRVPLVDRSVSIEQMLAVVSAGTPWAFVSCFGAIGVVLVCTAVAWRRGAGRLSIGTGLIWCLLVVAAPNLGLPTSSSLLLAVAAGPEAPPSP